MNWPSSPITRSFRFAYSRVKNEKLEHSGMVLAWLGITHFPLVFVIIAMCNRSVVLSLYQKIKLTSVSAAFFGNMMFAAFPATCLIIQDVNKQNEQLNSARSGMHGCMKME